MICFSSFLLTCWAESSAWEGGSLAEQFHLLNGKKIYLHTLDTFYELNIFDEIILVTNKDFIDSVKEDISKYKNIKVIRGGIYRQESAYLALKASNNANYVVFHDAVRPFVTKKIIIDNLDAAIKYKAVNTCIKSTDTVVEVNKDNMIFKIPNREFLRRGQTPQTFEYKLILNAHENALKKGIKSASDDCQLVLEKTNIYVVNGDINNIKITTPSDLIIAQNILNQKKSPSILKTNKSLKNKIFAVVGASGGIGKEIVKFLKKEKAKTLEISRTSEFRTDLEDFSSIEKTFEKIFKTYGQIDGLINTAGLLLIKPFQKLTISEIDKLLKVNLIGLVYSCKAAKIKENGHIINISSTSYKEGRKDYGIYSATKAAVVNFTQSLAKENPKLKINTIAPGRTDTQMRKNIFPHENPNLLLSPTEVAEKIINILKDDSITGSVIEIKK